MFWPTSTFPVYTVTLPFSPMCSQASISLGRASPLDALALPDSCGQAVGLKTGNHQNTGAQQLEKIAPIEIKVVHRARCKFVTLGLPGSRNPRGVAHGRPPVPAADLASAVAAFCTALMIRE